MRCELQNIVQEIISNSSKNALDIEQFALKVVNGFEERDIIMREMARKIKELEEIVIDLTLIGNASVDPLLTKDSSNK